MEIGILMGSKSDTARMDKCIEVLKNFGVEYEFKTLSAHRMPEEVADYAQKADQRGIKVLICGAGMAAHLAGAVAANCVLPVIGIPLSGSALNGLDALLSTVQMPKGIPVATVAVDGAENAGYLAVQILALNNPSLKSALLKHRREAAQPK
ncbi:MAG: 5-(carboxyamino)imidazole ribonucleotide mutase [Candidatus Brocadiia bacterium]